MKSWWVTVLEGHKKQIYQKQCLTVKEAKEVEHAKKEEFPNRETHKVVREWY